MIAEALVRLLGDSSVVSALVLGTIAGLGFGIAPGLSGRIGLLVAMPWALAFEPFAGAVFLVALHAVVHTSSAIPAILVGVPTSAAESATVVDGYPLMRAHRGAEAIGGMLTGSVLGGAAGAVALLALVPVMIPLVAHFAAPEIAMLALIGLLSVSSLAGGNLPAAVMTASLGVLASTIGLDAFTGTPRFTFGRLELWDGAEVAAVIAGLFVIPELLARRRDTETAPVAATRIRDVVRAAIAALSHWFLIARTSIIGILVGFLPGIGASAAVWLAYGHATQTTRPAVPFGQGAIEGVLAAETANNSKEGGVLAPTLFFGIPGSSGMAILMVAFATLGIEVGPRLVARDPGFVVAIAWTILLANFIAVPICLAITPTLAYMARLRRTEVVIVSLTIATLSVLALSPGAFTVAQLAVFGALGAALGRAGWPRAPFVLGFVMGPIFESALVRTAMIWGSAALMRPGVLTLALVAVLILVTGRRARQSIGERAGQAGDAFAAALAACLAALFAAASATAMATFPFPATTAPTVAAATGAAAGAWLLVRHRAGRPLPTEAPRTLDGRSALLYGGTLALAVGGGPAPAAALLAGGGFYWLARRSMPASVAVGLIAGIAAGVAAGSASLR